MIMISTTSLIFYFWFFRVVAEAKSVVNPKNVYFYPPITNPDKVICVGLNYKGHCDEQNKPYPQEPFFFSKFPSTIVGPNDEVIHPPNSKVSIQSGFLILFPKAQ